MHPLAIAFILLSAIFHALRDFLTKRSVDKQIFMWWFSATSVVINIPMVLWVVAHDGFPQPMGVVIGFCISFIHFLYWYGLAKALEHGDLSHVYPIIRSSPALVLLASMIIFGESISLQGGLGIVLVAVGAYTMNLNKVSMRGFLEPLQTLRHDHALQYALLTLATVTIYTIVDDRGVEYAHPIVYFFLINTLSWMWYSLYVFRVKKRAEFPRVWKKAWGTILINGVLGLASYVLLLMSYKLEYASEVAGFRQLSIVFAVLLGGHILKERNRAIRLCAALTIVVGAIFIAIAP